MIYFKQRQSWIKYYQFINICNCWYRNNINYRTNRTNHSIESCFVWKIWSSMSLLPVVIKEYYPRGKNSFAGIRMLGDVWEWIGMNANTWIVFSFCLNHFGYLPCQLKIDNYLYSYPNYLLLNLLLIELLINL